MFWEHSLKSWSHPTLPSAGKAKPREPGIPLEQIPTYTARREPSA